MGATRAFEPALSEVSFLALFTSSQVVQNMALELVLAYILMHNGSFQFC